MNYFEFFGNTQIYYGLSTYCRLKLHTKGLLISKCLINIFNSPKKWTKKFDFTTMVPQVKEGCNRGHGLSAAIKLGRSASRSRDQLKPSLTSSWIVKVCFLGELETPKRHFEINWTLSHLFWLIHIFWNQKLIAPLYINIK